ncbi:siderophore synthetase component [Janthinobacterium sp. CG_23.3]|uniref:IucA/IucC family protein n=1 Tax=Janthinobacterium sp. CG_23.3 TaxID=3349634 RepID=UPI0038D409BC
MNSPLSPTHRQHIERAASGAMTPAGQRRQRGYRSPQFAEEQHCRLLVNCYAREVAMQEHTLAVLPAAHAAERLPTPADYQGQVLDIALPRVDSRLRVGVLHVSATGNFDYTTEVFVQRGQGAWRAAGWEALARLIIEDLSARANTDFNAELLQQIGDSIATMRDLLARLPAPRRPGAPVSPLQAYIDSEQSLLTGHPFHPAPKSRSDWSPDEQRHYSPEHQARLTLRHFQVPREWIVSDSLDQVPASELLDQLSAHGLHADAGCVIVPLHPWQADWLARQDTIAAAMRDGLVRDLGAHGLPFHPTASIRTLLAESADCFLKLSLSMRITNCVRTNARHELESALTGTRLYRAMKAEMQGHFPRFHVLEERAFLTVAIPGGHGERHRELENGFGLVVREGLGKLIRDGVNPVMCAALFGNGEHGRQQVFALIERFALHHGHPLERAARLWFARYADAAVYPILYLLFEKGVAFEPHMQNTVVGLDPDGAPSHIVLRDLELTRLAPKAHALARALGLDPATLEQLCCSDERAWTRIGYCLFVNNLCEVVATISNGNHALYLELWGVLRHTLQNYLLQFPSPEANRRIQGLLAGEPLPAKGNLLTRFLRQADRQASYLPLYHPLGVVNGAPAAAN